MANLKGKIILVKDIKLDRNYINVLSYTESEMLELCQANAVATQDDYSFIRNTGNIFTNFTYSQCLQANYIAFQNKDYSNKWFFAFIDDVIFKGEENTEIKYTVDSWSTWYDYWTKKNCFIERQHELVDTIGSNIVEENINVGDVIEESETTDTSYSNEFGYFIGIMSGYTPADGQASGGNNYAGISILNNVISGFNLFLFKITDRADLFNVVLFLARTNDDGKIADINNMFIIPNACINESILQLHTFPYTVGSTSITCSYYTIPMSGDEQVFNPVTFNTTITKRTSFSNFSPKNLKCFIYPYNYLYVSNNQGSNNIYKYEDFSGNNCVFENQLAVCVGISGRIVPKNYKGKTMDYDESLTLGKYPTCGWSGDAYVNWLTANAVNIPSQITGSVIGSVTQFASGNVVGGLTSISNTIANTIGQFYQASLLPNISGGQAQGDISFSASSMGFTFRQMRAKTEFLRIIDDYFTRFGYAIKRIDNPHITGRRYWNYIEIGSNENIGYGSVPSKYMEEINGACRKGVTIWHNHDNLGDFSLNNTIV
jgi:hypothetical protein